MNQQTSYARRSTQVCHQARSTHMQLNGLSNQGQFSAPSKSRRAILWLYCGVAIAALLGIFL